MASRLGLIARNAQRFYSSAAGHGQDRAAVEKAAKFWGNVHWFVGLPGLALVFYNAYYVMPQHPERAEFVPYEHLRIRNKPFPWGNGDKSLFHNPYYNALPDGYEEGSEDLHPGSHH